MSKLEQISAWCVAITVAWIPIATVLARYIPRPAPEAHWWWRLLFDLIIDNPAARAAQGRVGIFGGQANLPFVPSRLPVDNPTPAASRLMKLINTSRPPPLPPPPGDAALLLLMAIGLVGMIAGCHGWKTPAYATLTTLADGADAAVKVLPGACEAAELAVVNAATTRAEATAKTDAIHARCEAVASGFAASAKGLRVGRDEIQKAPDKDALKALAGWITAAKDAYCSTRAMLEVLVATGVKMDVPPSGGVC